MDKSTFLRGAILFPLGLMVVTTIYLAAAFDIASPFSAPGEISPRGIPILMAILMYVALLVVLVQEIRAPATDLPDQSPDDSVLRPALVVLATAGYILLFRPLGYSISTLFFVAALFCTFGFETRRPVRFALYAIGVTAVFYGLFALVFGVRLPTLPGINL